MHYARFEEFRGARIPHVVGICGECFVNEGLGYAQIQHKRSVDLVVLLEIGVDKSRKLIAVKAKLGLLMNGTKASPQIDQRTCAETLPG